MKNILVYEDQGAACTFDLVRVLKNYFVPKGYKIEKVKAEDILKHDALEQNVTALFMPGGVATPYMNKLQTLGNNKIRNFVKNGGIYFGICAGAYYASCKSYFEKDIPELALEQEFGLNLIEAEAVGTLREDLKLKAYDKPSAENATVVRLRWVDDGEEHFIFYHGGPKFMKVADSIVLAEYEDVKGKAPAVLMREYGKGKVVVSGVHLEDDWLSVAKMMSATMENQDRARLNYECMKQNELSRMKFWHKIMGRVFANNEAR